MATIKHWRDDEFFSREQSTQSTVFIPTITSVKSGPDSFPVGTVSYDESGQKLQVQTQDGNIPIRTPRSRIVDSLRNNLLTVTEKIPHIALEELGEDQFKKRSKVALSAMLTQEIIKKTKFTMLNSVTTNSTITKARVYVFSEEEMNKLIEDIENNCVL